MAKSTNQSPNGNERPDTIEEALRVLDRALAGKSASLNEMLTAEFGNLKSAISGFSGESGTGVGRDTRQVIEPYIQQVTDFSRNIDQRVRANPWPLVGGVALGTFAIGFLLGGRPESIGERGVRYDQ